jgi:hypothetical protein
VSEHLEMLPIVYCPVCCTNMDADGWGEQHLECGNCETSFTVMLEREKVAAHSMVG